MHYNGDTIIEIKPGVMKPEIAHFFNSTKCGV